MSGKYWIKLYHEILYDRKTASLDDHLWRRTIEIFLMAGEMNESGYLPPLADMAWTLRAEAEQLETDLNELIRIGILEFRDEKHFVRKFDERQEPMPKAEYMRRLREEEQKQEHYESLPDGYQSVTNGNADTDTDTDTDINSVPFEDILQAWKESFPNKPQPRINTKSIKAKIKARWNSSDFQENWQIAMVRASNSPTLQSESWFDFRFFIRNDENYQKCLDGWMNWKDKQLNGQPKKRLPEGI